MPPKPPFVPSVENTELLKERKEKLNQPLYYPTIFRYKCRGAFFATSDEPGSKGICRGIQTQLKHVRDLHKSTEQESIDIFLQAANYPRRESDTNSLMKTQAMIYDFSKNDASDEKDEEKSSASGAVDDQVKSSNEAEQERDQLQSAAATIAISNSPATTEEDDEWHDWYCYGSTEVHLLVLRDVKTNQEKTVGIAPDCRLGVSIRDVGQATSGDTLATLRLGPVEISLGNHYEIRDENDEKEHPRHSAHARRSTKKLKNEEGANKNDDIVNKKSEHKESSGLTTQKVFDKSKKIAEAMLGNAIILRDAVKEDFPQRCWESSQRVAGQFGKTVDRTAKLAQDLYRIWKNDDDDDDE